MCAAVLLCCPLLAGARGLPFGLVSSYHCYLIPFSSSPLLLPLTIIKPSLRAVSFASVFRSHCLLACLQLPPAFVLLRGVDLTTWPVPAAFLHSVLRLSLSVSAHLCPSLPFLASSAALCIVLSRSTVRTPPHTTIDGDDDSSRGGDSKQQRSPASAPPPAPNASSITHWDPAGREAIGRGSRTSLLAHHRLQLSPLRNHHRIAVSWAARTATIRRNTP